MTREEFIMHLNCIEQNHNEENLTCTISEEDYKIVEDVYTWHPAISNTEGKQEIATLYYIAGMGLITNMYPEAHVAMEAHQQIQSLKNRLRVEEERIESIKSRYGNFRLLREVE